MEGIQSKNIFWHVCGGVPFFWAIFDYKTGELLIVRCRPKRVLPQRCSAHSDRIWERSSFPNKTRPVLAHFWRISDAFLLLQRLFREHLLTIPNFLCQDVVGKPVLTPTMVSGIGMGVSQENCTTSPQRALWHLPFQLFKGGVAATPSPVALQWAT